MNCKICGHHSCKRIYYGKIRRGSFGKLTSQDVEMLQCKKCGVIWHDDVNDGIDAYYNSEEYRTDMSECGGASVYYENHDKEVLEKLKYTGTDIFRNKIVADIGCGGGSFLDFLLGVAKSTIGIEPTEVYRSHLKEQGHIGFAYTKEAIAKFEEKVEVVTSFDVLEHVEEPLEFLCEIKRFCAKGANVVIGTPSEQPVMRETIGKEYDSFLFSYQHPWIFNEKSLRILFEKAQFHDITISYKQRYGLGNLIAWLKYKKPLGNVSYDFLSEEIEALWTKNIEKNKLADYLVVYAKA